MKTIEAPAVDLQQFENDAHRRGFLWVSGIDEAGRGPLAGPVVAAAVLFPPDADPPPARDSKALSPRRRESLLVEILGRATAVGIGCVEAPVIDSINILQATFLAMELALRHLQPAPDLLLIDGPYRLPLPTPQLGIPGGDRRSVSIAAASIVAKVHRDGLMDRYHDMYPAYGFDRNRGYGTAQHREALRRWGPCPLHRRSFMGVERGGSEGEGLKR
ncbi:MAG: ribonuclease HII [Syntrophobacteraceae bacterium]|nr:ribonuclease HII [Syntrophobacteraceae bacterium]